MIPTRVVALALAMTMACSRGPIPSARAPGTTTDAPPLPLIATAVAASPIERDLTAATNVFIQALTATPDTALTDATDSLPNRCLALSGLAGPGADRATRLHRLADEWRGSAVHSPTVEEEDSAQASVGPLRPAMTTLCFHRVAGTWPVVGWIPGE